MDEQTSLTTAAASGDESFDIAVRGYSRPQVQQFVTRATVRIRDLEEQLTATAAELEQARTAALQAHRELAEARASVGAKPAHEELSGRLSQILRLAAEEADQERAKAEEEIAQARRAAEEQVQQLVAHAQQQSQQIIDGAQAEADEAVSTAREQSDYLLRTSQTQSEQLMRTSRAESERMLTDAERRASAVNEESTTRLDALTETHGEVVRRLAQIRDVLADLLAQDDAAGSLAAAVDAALGLSSEQGEAVGTGALGAVPAQGPVPGGSEGAPEEAQAQALGGIDAAQPVSGNSDVPEPGVVADETAEAEARKIPRGGGVHRAPDDEVDAEAYAEAEAEADVDAAAESTAETDAEVDAEAESGAEDEDVPGVRAQDVPEVQAEVQPADQDADQDPDQDQDQVIDLAQADSRDGDDAQPDAGRGANGRAVNADAGTGSVPAAGR